MQQTVILPSPCNAANRDLPKEADDEYDLWQIKYDDGDDEQWSKKDLADGIILYEEDPPTDHSESEDVLTLVIRITDLVGYTGISFMVLGATAWTSALQHLLTPIMDSGDDPTHAHGMQVCSTVAFHLSLS